MTRNLVRQRIVARVTESSTGPWSDQLPEPRRGGTTPDVLRTRMVRRRQAPSPVGYLPLCHPEYLREQTRFILGQLVGGDIRRRLLQDVACYLDTHFRRLRDLFVRMEMGDQDAVFETIRLYGLWNAASPDAIDEGSGAKTILLRMIKFAGDRRLPTQPPRAVLLRQLRDAQRTARSYIELWQKMVRHRKPADRLLARTRLRAVGAALVPEMRGQRTRQARGSPFEIAWDYWAEVFRWRQVRGLIRQWPWSPLRAEKIRAAWLAYRLDELTEEPTRVDRDDLLRFCGITSKGHLVQPRRVEEIARTVTARRFGITATRVANILSAQRK